MRETKDKIVNLETLGAFYSLLYKLCPPSAADAAEGLALGIVDGRPQWTSLKISGGGTKPVDPYYYLSNSEITINSNKTQNGSATWTYDETTHDLSVTFDAVSEGIILGNGWSASDTIQVYFDEVVYNPEISDAAKEYIGLYDNKAVSAQGYDNTSGMTAAIDSTPGVQINTSSKYVSSGNGTLPITVTYKNIRLLVNGGNSGETPADTSLVASNVTFNGTAKTAWTGAWDANKTLYVELTTNNHTTNTGNILSFGQNISQWSGTNGYHIHLYYPMNSNRSTIGVAGLNQQNVTTANFTIDNSNDIIRVAASANGLFINGVDATNANSVSAVLGAFGSMSTIDVGSSEGSNRYTGVYNEIRVFNKAYTTTELQDITTSGYNK